MLDKSFDPARAEPRLYEAWEKSGAFRPSSGGAPFTIVIPPPNVTGSLHMGHALNNTLQDVLCRFERMRGRSVLWQPGTDHAGIATQMVVERQMLERQEPKRTEIGRTKFLEKVWKWKAESGGTIISQLKRLGASCDWSRERFTMDEGLSEAVLKTFVDEILKHLAGKKKQLDLPLDIQATAFQMQVWELLRKIPYGETVSYSQIAELLGDKKKVRAVARACANNRVAVVIPCHRVVGKNGNLAGYRWGIKRKEKLLEIENS